MAGREALFTDACVNGFVQAFEDLAAQDDPFRYPLFQLRPRR